MLTFKEACTAGATLFEAMPEMRTVHVTARSAARNQVSVLSPVAERWCAIGIVAAGMEKAFLSGQELRRLDNASYKLYGIDQITTLNDSSYLKVNNNDAVVDVLRTVGSD